MGLEDERALLYSDWIRIALGEAARAALEEMMHTQGVEFQSEFARRHTALGQARAVLRVLDKRGLTLSEAQQQRITECTDPETLDRWLDRALTVTSADALFD